MKPRSGKSADQIIKDGISTVLANAAGADDADAAAIFAHVLNTDLAAIEIMTGRRRFGVDDALRISRILSEYEQLARFEQRDSVSAASRPAPSPPVKI